MTAEEPVARSGGLRERIFCSRKGALGIWTVEFSNSVRILLLENYCISSESLADPSLTFQFKKKKNIDFYARALRG